MAVNSTVTIIQQLCESYSGLCILVILALIYVRHEIQHGQDSLWISSEALWQEFMHFNLSFSHLKDSQCYLYSSSGTPYAFLSCSMKLNNLLYLRYLFPVWCRVFSGADMLFCHCVSMSFSQLPIPNITYFPDGDFCFRVLWLQMKDPKKQECMVLLNRYQMALKITGKAQTEALQSTRTRTSLDS